MRYRTFELREEHLRLLAESWWEVDYDGPYWRTTGQDPKRPYGNSDVLGDVAEVVYGKDWRGDDDESYAEEILGETRTEWLVQLCDELPDALGVVTQCRTFEPGLYRREEYSSRPWEPAP